MKNKLKLILPNKKYVNSYIKMEKEFQAEGTKVAAGGMDLINSPTDFTNYNKKIRNQRKGIDIPKNRVPHTLYWAIAGGKVVGRLDLRHNLKVKYLFNVGGHIGYAVKPSERRRGYGTEMLRFGLRKCKSLGMKKVLVTCNEKNIASKKIIEANGGTYQNKMKDKGMWFLRFWIKV